MTVVDALYLWTDRLVFVGLTALRLWAVVDCATRKAAAFPAAGKLTKPAWLAITGFSAAFGTLVPQVTGPISLISVIVAAVYLADVRPAVREISGGGRRW